MAGEWRTWRLSEVYDFSSGLSKPREEFGFGFGFLTFKDVLDNYFAPPTLSALVNSTEKERNVCSVRRGDVFLTRTSETQDELGMSCVALKDYESATFNGFTKRLRPKPDADVVPEYAAYFFRGPRFRRDVTAMSSLSTRASLNNEMLDRLTIVLPPRTVQSAIGRILKALDDKIELNRRMNATLEAMARALFQSWFVDFDPVRAKLDGRPPAGLDKATADLFPAAFEDSPLGPVPKGWKIGTIDNATSLILDYRGRTPKKLGSDWSASGVPAISAKNVKGGRLVRPDTFNFVSPELFERWMKDKLAVGDVLLTSEAPLGEMYYLALSSEYCLSQRLFALRAHPDQCVSVYLYYWIESAQCQLDIINRGTGTTVEGIRQSELRKVSVLLPPLSIQRLAANHLSPWTERVHRNEEESRTLAALRDALLPRLLSGELRVPEVARIESEAL
jgi:type I restriction enzyme S subunit